MYLVNPVEPILSSGQYVCNNSHSLLAVAELADVVLQVEGARLVGGEASQVSLQSLEIISQVLVQTTQHLFMNINMTCNKDI